MDEQQGEQSRFLWRFNSQNLNVLPERVRDNRLQQHVGQVVRGVLPGSRNQPAYHPNPYLQHLYQNTSLEEGGGGGGVVRGDNLQQSLDDFEAQLQEVIAQDVPDASGSNNNHQHSHAADQDPILNQVDWKALLGSVSFVIILFLRLMVDHLLGLLLFIGLSVVFYYANMKMIEIVHITSLRDRQTGSKVVLTSLWLIVFLSANLLCVYWFFDDQKLWRVLYCQLPTGWQGTVFDLFWVTMVTDYVLRFIGIMFKAVISIAPKMCFPQRKKGKYYMVIETFMQLYRTILPIVPWLHFLFDQPKSGKLIFAAILVVIYLALKTWTLHAEYVKVAKAVKIMRTDTKHGVQPTQEELQSCGEHNCPICQDDYQDPVILSCKHIFCENCVSIWFDREKTCPMCRAQIQEESPVWQDGSTSPHIQWF